MTKVAVATTSQLAADGASQVAELGGNAVDCALAAALFTMNTEPGVCALAGSAYVTVWNPDSSPVTIDGNVAVPGKGLSESERGHATDIVTLDYGGGITTLCGPGSVAVPGSLAAIERAWSYLVTPSGRTFSHRQSLRQETGFRCLLPAATTSAIQAGTSLTAARTASTRCTVPTASSAGPVTQSSFLTWRRH